MISNSPSGAGFADKTGSFGTTATPTNEQVYFGSLDYMNQYAMNQGTKGMTLKYSYTTAQEYKLANDLTTLENLNTFTFTDSGST